MTSVKKYNSNINIVELDNYVWDSLFCMSRSYDDAKVQGCGFRMLILSIAYMLSSIAKRYNYTPLINRFENTIYFFKEKNCTCDKNFENLCPTTTEIFEFMNSYFNFCGSREGKELATLEQHNVKYTVPKLTKSWWGPILWKVIHSFASFYDKDHDPDYFDAYKCFIMCLVYELPCKICRKHFKGHISKSEFNINAFQNSNVDLLYWTVSVHNGANASLEKTEFPWNNAMEIYLVPI